MQARGGGTGVTENTVSPQPSHTRAQRRRCRQVARRGARAWRWKELKRVLGGPDGDRTARTAGSTRVRR